MTQEAAPQHPYLEQHPEAVQDIEKAQTLATIEAPQREVASIYAAQAKVFGEALVSQSVSSPEDSEEGRNEHEKKMIGIQNYAKGEVANVFSRRGKDSIHIQPLFEQAVALADGATKLATKKSDEASERYDYVQQKLNGLGK